MTGDRAVFSTLQFAMVICRNPETGAFLAVNETKGRGWSIPGGSVNYGETFRAAAVRECLEESDVEVTLKGVLLVSHQQFESDYSAVTRVYFYAEPKNPTVVPK